MKAGGDYCSWARVSTFDTRARAAGRVATAAEPDAGQPSLGAGRCGRPLFEMG